MTRKVPWQAVDLAKRYEGYRSEAYLCPAGVWTCGWGHTLAVSKGVHCTPRSASLWLDEDLTTAAKRLERKIGEGVVLALTDNQYGALLDFVFNLGVGDPKKPEWAIWKVLRAKDFDGVPAQLTRFCYAGGKKLEGLVKRRAAEVEMWNRNEPGLSTDEANSAELRVTPTPPAPVGQPRTAHIVAACIAACGGIAEGAKQVSNIVQPFADQSVIVQNGLSLAAAVGAGAAVLVALLVWLQHRSAKV